MKKLEIQKLSTLLLYQFQTLYTRWSCFFLISNFFINKNSQGRKLSVKKKYLLAVIQLQCGNFWPKIYRILYPSDGNLATHTSDHQETEIVHLKNLSKSRDTDKKVVFLPYFSSHVFLMSLQLFFVLYLLVVNQNLFGVFYAFLRIHSWLSVKVINSQQTQRP